ncbi:MAG: hypothetical protein NTV33_12630 [Coprothermobacterota bacterium]|nr:hypothetical protein [Coprothermobacterota bacterium]
MQTIILRCIKCGSVYTASLPDIMAMMIERVFSALGWDRGAS